MTVAKLRFFKGNKWGVGGWAKGNISIGLETRLHSSRMRTARALTVSPIMLCTAPGVGGVPGPGGTWLGGVVPGLGGYLIPGRGNLFRGAVPGPGGYLVLGDVPGLWGCTWPGGYLVWGVCLVRWGVPGSEGGVPGQVLPSCEQNHTHL